MNILVTVYRDLDFCRETAAKIGKNCPRVFVASVPVESLSHFLRSRILLTTNNGCYPQSIDEVWYTALGYLTTSYVTCSDFSPRQVKSNSDKPKDVLAALEVAFSGPE